jgi:hypothetical protein
MNPLTCSQVEEQIDLFAAAECDGTTTAAIERHLAACRSCAGKVETARQLLGLLDLRSQEPELLRRLRAKVEIEAHRRRRPTVVPRFVRRFSAAAALCLVTFGLAGSLERHLSPDHPGDSEPITSSLAPATRLAQEDMAPAAVRLVPKKEGPPAPPQHAQAGRTTIVEGMAKSGAVFREELRAGLAAGRLSPQRVDLELYLFNPGPGDLTLTINERTEVEIDLRGPRVVIFKASAAASQPPIPAQTIHLPAGQGQVVRFTRLVSVSPRGASYSYWTEPGEYELRVRLWTEALQGTEGATRRPVTVTVTSQPIKIRVVGKS